MRGFHFTKFNPDDGGKVVQIKKPCRVTGFSIRKEIL